MTAADRTSPEFAARAAEAEARIAELTASIKAIDDPVRQRAFWPSGRPRTVPRPRRRCRSRAGISTTICATAWAVCTARRMAAQAASRRRPAPRRPGDATSPRRPLTAICTAKTLEVWLSLDNLAASRRRRDGRANARRRGVRRDRLRRTRTRRAGWPAATTSRARKASHGPPETEADKRTRPRGDRVRRRRHDHGLSQRPGRMASPTGLARLRRSRPARRRSCSACDTSPGGNQSCWPARSIAPSLYDRALTAEEVAASPKRRTSLTRRDDRCATVADGSPPNGRRASRHWLQLSKRGRRSREADCATPSRRGRAEPAQLLVRGDTRHPGDVVTPGGVASLRRIERRFRPGARRARRRAARGAGALDHEPGTIRCSPA